LEAVETTGQWVLEESGETMLDPQTSGLINDEVGLWTISDRSADKSQIQQLHLLDRDSGAIIKRYGPMRLSAKVINSCFATYLGDNPDYEAIVLHPFKRNAWLLVTEDATNSPILSGKCADDFAKTGSTEYPTLLVEVTKQDEELIVSGVRAIQFPHEAQVGDFPNDGIEGLSIAKDNTLYLGLEKDNAGQPRVFKVALSADVFEQTERFLQVEDAQLNMPVFSQGNHPINGMDIYYPDDASDGYLLAAARNDNELWVIDLTAQQPTTIIPLVFLAQSDDAQCATNYKMDNASIEGVAVADQQLILINDPWKVNYLKNVTCESQREKYERMSPLIFSLPIDSNWFVKR
jgi:hypothetical protein